MTAATPLSIAVVTVSDTRTEDTDKSGAQLVSSLEQAGHRLYSKVIVPDDVYRLRATVSVSSSTPSRKPFSTLS